MSSNNKARGKVEKGCLQRCLQVCPLSHLLKTSGTFNALFRLRRLSRISEPSIYLESTNTVWKTELIRN